jgi:hypothetical protein
MLLCMHRREDCIFSRLPRFIVADILYYVLRAKRGYQALPSPIALLSCRHAFHDECWKHWHEKRPICPICSEPRQYSLLTWTTWCDKGIWVDVYDYRSHHHHHHHHQDERE